MKRIFKRSFSIFEVFGLIMMIFLWAAYDADAQTTVPNTFTAGTTIKASEVNANFGALATAIDSIPAGATGATGPIGATGATGTSGSPDTAVQVRSKFFSAACEGNDTTDIMVRVGPLCVDKYEAKVINGSGTQVGDVSDNYPCNDNGNDCSDTTAASNIFARSEAGVTPSQFITWFQAQQACANSFKRLLTNAEWQMAAAGTPDPGAGGNGTTTCNTSTGGLVATGSTGDCVSNWGVNDMVGNLWEWVADWVPRSTNCPGWGGLSDDSMCLSGADTIATVPGALLRGGNWLIGTNAGVFALDATNGPTFSTNNIGFRCAR